LASLEITILWYIQGSKGKAPHVLSLRCRWRWAVSFMLWSFYSREKRTWVLNGRLSGFQVFLELRQIGKPCSYPESKPDHLASVSHFTDITVMIRLILTKLMTTHMSNHKSWKPHQRWTSCTEGLWWCKCAIAMHYTSTTGRWTLNLHAHVIHVSFAYGVIYRRADHLLPSTYACWGNMISCTVKHWQKAIFKTEVHTFLRCILWNSETLHLLFITDTKPCW
jgi:hypothetical protein